MGEYHVMWRFPKQRAQRATYDAPSLPVVLRILANAEGVCPSTCDEMFIHYHATDGSVLEVFTHDKESGVTNFNHEVPKDKKPPQSAVVVPLNPGKSDKKKNKPHIRLTTLPSQEGALGLFMAFQA